MLAQCEVVEGLPELVDGHLHLEHGLRLQYHDAVLDPALLLLGEHEVLAGQLLLPVVLGDDHADEQVHQEEVAEDHHHHEEQARHRVEDLVAVLVHRQVHTAHVQHLVHQVAPLDDVRNDEDCDHRVAGVVEVQKTVLPGSAHVQAVPFGVDEVYRAFDNVIVVAIKKFSLEIVDSNDTNDKNEYRAD